MHIGQTVYWVMRYLNARDTRHEYQIDQGRVISFDESRDVCGAAVWDGREVLFLDTRMLLELEEEAKSDLEKIRSSGRFLNPFQELA